MTVPGDDPFHWQASPNGRQTIKGLFLSPVGESASQHVAKWSIGLREDVM